MRYIWQKTLSFAIFLSYHLPDINNITNGLLLSLPDLQNKQVTQIFLSQSIMEVPKIGTEFLLTKNKQLQGEFPLIAGIAR